MTTPILPTKAQLSGLTFSPRQLIADAEIELFLTTTNDYDFILKLIAAYRSGVLASWENTGVPTSFDGGPTYTEFVYFCNRATLDSLIVFLTSADYGYGYTVRVAKGTEWETRTAPITTFESDPYILLTGAKSGSYALLVSWA